MFIYFSPNSFASNVHVLHQSQLVGECFLFIHFVYKFCVQLNSVAVMIVANMLRDFSWIRWCRGDVLCSVGYITDELLYS